MNKTKYSSVERLCRILSGMKNRCGNPNTKGYKYYGARGIRVCDEWLGKEGVDNFVRWAFANGYADNLTIDRIDSIGDYSPSNCRWISLSENVRRSHVSGDPSISACLEKVLSQSGRSFSDLGRYLRIPECDLAVKISEGRWTAEELAMAAKMVGARFGFTYPNGQIIIITP